jgi:hypothetical protein
MRMAGVQLVVASLLAAGLTVASPPALSSQSTSTHAPDFDQSSVLASSVSNLSVTLSTNAATAADVTYTVRFSTSASGTLAANSGVIALVAPPTTTLAYLHGFTLAIGEGGAVPVPPSILPGASTVDITVPQAIPALTRVTLVMTGVTNSTSPGGNLVLSTSSDTAPVEAPLGLVAPSVVSDPHIGLSDLAAGSPATLTFSLRTSATGALVANSGIVTMVAPVGTDLAGAVFTMTDGGSTVPVVPTIAGNVADLLVGADIPPSSLVQVVATQVANPGGGTYSMGLSTSSDPTPWVSNTYTITGAAPALTSLTGVAAALSSRSAAASNVVATVHFVARTSMSATGSVLLAAPTGTSFSTLYRDYTFDDVTKRASSVAASVALADRGAVVSIDVPAPVQAGNTIVLTVDAIENSATPGGDLSVSTTQDPLPVTVPLHIAAPTSVASPKVTVTSTAEGATDVSDNFSFRASATGGVAAPTTLSPSGVIVTLPPGTAVPASAVYTFADETEGVWGEDAAATVVATNTVAVTPPEAFQAGDLVVLSISGLTNPSWPSPAMTVGISTTSDVVPADATIPAIVPGTEVSGTVVGPGGAAVPDAEVQVCSSATSCGESFPADQDGNYSALVVAGPVTITAFPSPYFVDSEATGSRSLTIKGNAPLKGVDVALMALKKLPSDVTFTGAVGGAQSGGVPLLVWDLPTSVTVTACKNGIGAMLILGVDAGTGLTIPRVVTLTETPAGSGRYTGTVPPLAPLHGTATVDTFISCAPPTAVAPDRGPNTGGTLVEIYGQHLMGATAVHFGTQAATSLQVVSDSEIEAVTPPGSGSVPVTVTTPSGVSPETGIAMFSYTDITSLSTTEGPVGGGNAVVIHGSGFDSFALVEFGHRLAKMTANAPDAITAIAPPGSGTVAVRVLEPGGATALTRIDLYSYGTIVAAATKTLHTGLSLAGTAFDLPYLRERQDRGSAHPVTSTVGTTTGVSSANGAVGQVSGGPVLLSGGELIALVSGTLIAGIGDGLLVGGIIASGAGASTAAAITVAAGAGLLTVGLGILLGLVLLAAFSQPPSCASGGQVVAFAACSPDQGDDSSGNALVDPSGTVLDTHGHPIDGAMATIFGSPGLAGPFHQVSATGPGIRPAVNPETTGATGTFHWDVSAGYYRVQASAPGCRAPGRPSQSTVSTPGFPVPPPVDDIVLTLACPNQPPPARPNLSGLSPSSGPTRGGTEVTLTGAGFTAGTSVSFGSHPASQVTVVAPTAITVVAPPGSGTVAVFVRTPQGRSSSRIADKFTYIAPPVVTGLRGKSGPAAGGTSVTILGKGFSGAYRVDFGSSPSTQMVVLSDSEIIATSPPGKGTVDITVTTWVGNSSINNTDRFAYRKG